jgi:hypothetical protein
MAGLLMDGGEFRAQRKEDVRSATSILSDDHDTRRNDASSIHKRRVVA